MFVLQQHSTPPPSLVACADIRFVYAVLRRDNEAEPLCRRALDISEQIYGLNHPKVATCLNNLATQASKQASNEGNCCRCFCGGGGGGSGGLNKMTYYFILFDHVPGFFFGLQ